MNWWVLTYLDIYRPPHTLSILAETNNRDHMFMAWSTIKPARQRVHKTVRGLHVFCGYRWIWNTPNIVEQSQPGGTREHLFGPIPLTPTDPVWFYLFALPALTVAFRQTALFHVPPPELPMPSARLTHDTFQWIQPTIETPLTFNTVRWDDYSLYDPGQPTRLTAPVGALYAIGGGGYLHLAINCGARLAILVNGTQRIAMHGHYIEAIAWAEAHLTIGTIWPLHPGDYVILTIEHDDAVQRHFWHDHDHSPEFWMYQIGAYPISPP